MALTAFTGPPGSGKSHALVKDVILPAVMSGRRVLSNIDGLDVDAIRAYCLERVQDSAHLGEVICFHGDDALKTGFFPDETTVENATFVKGGDLVVFDEWALYFPRRGNLPQGCNVEAFLRWHRHLTGPDGAATDVAIGTQLATDVHQNFRGLIVKSYKFRKLTALGAAGQYTWQLFEGHLQPKGGHYRTGTGSYDKAVFPLYASSAAAKEGTHVELKTNSKESVWNSWQAWGVIIAAPLLLIGGLVALWTVWSAPPDGEALAVNPNPSGALVPAQGVQQANYVPPPTSPWRIVGHIEGENGTRVIVADEKGGVRTMNPRDFEFDNGRPISGNIDGKRAVAEDRIVATGQAIPSPWGGELAR